MTIARIMLASFSLEGKTALVTGCKRGIGKAMAIGLAQTGAGIIGVSAPLEKTGGEVEAAILAAGSTFMAYTCDFSNRASLYTIIEEVKKAHPQIQTLTSQH